MFLKLTYDTSLLCIPMHDWDLHREKPLFNANLFAQLNSKQHRKLNSQVHIYLNLHILGVNVDVFMYAIYFLPSQYFNSHTKTTINIRVNNEQHQTLATYLTRLNQMCWLRSKLTEENTPIVSSWLNSAIIFQNLLVTYQSYMFSLWLGRQIYFYFNMGEDY